MSSSLKQNTTTIQELLTKINNLPEAVEQAAPTISVNTSGLITATAGTKSSTHQLAFQPAKTITPTTASQIAVSSGYYTGGNVTVAGDANLVAGNIKSGVSIFGVSGNYEGSGDTSMEDGLITRTLTSYTNDRVTNIYGYAFYCFGGLVSVSFPNVTSIGQFAFNSCTNLTTVSFPNVVSIGGTAFSRCSKLTTVSFPKATSIGNCAFQSCTSLTTVSFPLVVSISYSAFQSCTKLTTVSFPNVVNIGQCAFQSCTSLTTVSFPKATSIGGSAFFRCTSLTTVSFPKATSIGTGAFNGCSQLSSIYLMNTVVCTLSNSGAFSNTSIWSNKGSIFVPSSLVASYKTATNWVFFSNRIYSA